jgi:hypothetical protein
VTVNNGNKENGCVNHIAGSADWRLWGPYLSERQWGTVREDYSAGGTAWDYFPHDHARSRAYRWGEDGIAGISDAQQRLCVSLALWNGRDPILKERLFGLTNREGNHGEDVKEIYYYLDATPTHSYLKMLYKYPQRAYPYTWLVEENRRRGKDEPEFELFHTDAFDDDRYFDVFVEYAKNAAEDILLRITIWNRGPESAHIHVLPQVWFRNTWAWSGDVSQPELSQSGEGEIRICEETLGEYRFYVEGPAELLFTDNETNTERLYNYTAANKHYKDAFHEALINGRADAINPSRRGTKAAAHSRLTVPAGGERVLRARLCRNFQSKPFADFDLLVKTRLTEADQFYANLQTGMDNSDQRLIQRQALAGMIWSKQFFYYDIPQWLEGDRAQPSPPGDRKFGRNSAWSHLNNADILSMPDKWEFPWYASWDLAFHTVALALVDAEFAKQQLTLITREWYMHPNGELPAYEWAFSDVNPPVHGWAAWRVFQIDRKQRRFKDPDDTGDLAFLEGLFLKLVLNFTWWVNRKDAGGRNIFQGGFLGLDNIGVFDRSAPLPTGGSINQADGTSWMAMYSLNLMRIALELAQHNHVYEDMATKFLEHFLSIAQAMTNMADGRMGLWDDEDNFFFDALNLPNGKIIPLKTRSMVGLIPLFSVETVEPELLERVPDFKQRLEWYFNYRPNVAALVSHWNVPGSGERRLLSLLRGHRMKLLLKRMRDPNEFLAEYGVRSLSRSYLSNPYEFQWGNQTTTVKYEPGESSTGLFGGNSNWRGPIWFPLNFLIVESLQKFHHYYGDDFKVECPTGSGNLLTLDMVAQELTHRLSKIFLKNVTGVRPVFGDYGRLQDDLHFRDYLHFYEHFHGDTGRGVGASHQTGWTGLIAKLLQPRCTSSAIKQSETPIGVHA